MRRRVKKKGEEFTGVYTFDLAAQLIPGTTAPQTKGNTTRVQEAGVMHGIPAESQSAASAGGHDKARYNAFWE